MRDFEFPGTMGSNTFWSQTWIYILIFFVFNNNWSLVLMAERSRAGIWVCWSAPLVWVWTYLGLKWKRDFHQLQPHIRFDPIVLERPKLVQWRVEALMSNLEYDHPVIVRGFIIKTYDGAPSTGHDSFLLNSYALHLNYLKFTIGFSLQQTGGGLSKLTTHFFNHHNGFK